MEKRRIFRCQLYVLCCNDFVTNTSIKCFLVAEVAISKYRCIGLIVWFKENASPTRWFGQTRRVVMNFEIDGLLSIGVVI